MMIGTCGTCRHWTPYTGFHEFPRMTREPTETYEQLEVRQAAASAKYRECLAIPFAPEDFEPPAYTIDGSEYKAALFTSAEFGCTMYEEGSADLPSAEENHVP